MKIAVIGAGNVATHLAMAFLGQAEIVQVLARTPQSAASLASRINNHIAEGGAMRSQTTPCESACDLSKLRRDCDMYLIAVNDDAVAEVVKLTPDCKGIWAHTSGSVGLDVFEGRKTDYGVFYPLQTFSKEVAVDLSEVPVLVEGCNEEVTCRLTEMAGRISGTVRYADSSTREAIHEAAVFACNFANLMWCEADRLLRHDTGLDISFLMPLLRATLAKLSVKSPHDAMTGPARRGDIAVINKHLVALPADLKPVYSLLSERILEMYHPRQS